MWDFYSVRKDSDKFASCNTCNDPDKVILQGYARKGPFWKML